MSLRHALAGLALLAAGAAAAQPALFTPVPGADLAPRQADLLAALQASPAFVMADVGRADPDALLAASDVTVALPGGGAATLRLDRVERRGADDASWFGGGAGPAESGVFVVREGMVTGTVRTGGRLYTLRPLTGGLHALVQIDERAFRDHGEGYASFEAAELARLAREGALEAPAPDAMGGSAPVVTVLVPYTAAARAAVADMGAFVQLAVDETNQTYANSGIAARLALAYTYQTATAETASMDVDLPALATNGDGRFDELHALRTAHAADVVALLGSYGDYCGLGYLNATATSAFSVVAQSCATGYYSFGHEIGHNFGAHHDPAAGTNTTYAYGHGYVNAAAGWRTVMAYNSGACAGGYCERVPYWSNPDALYNGAPTGDVAVRDNARVIDLRAPAMAGLYRNTRQVTGAAGWRMLAAPVAGMTVDDLAAQNLVQGVPGYYPAAGANLYTGYDASGWVESAGAGETLGSGRGFIWYFYNQTFNPGGPSLSYALPATVAAPYALASPAANVAVSLHAGGDRWNLLGNPFASSLNVSGLAGWATGGVLASAVGQVWDPVGGTFALTSAPAMSNVVASWQGFFVENSTATGLTMPAAARATGGTFHDAMDVRSVAFELEGTEATTGQAILDRAIQLYFHPDGTDGWDLWDASKLTPLAPAYATLAFEGSRDGGPVLKAQESRPLTPAAAFSVPLSLEAVGTGTAFALRWPTLTNVPDAWTITLQDVVTGATVDLRAADHYAFTAEPAPARAAAPQAAAADAGRATTRFVLHVAPGLTTDGGAGPAPLAFALGAPAPNPAAGAATLRFDVPAPSEVAVEVFDVTGRRVGVLAEGRAEAGRHALRLDASALAPGVYVVRARAGALVLTRRVTVAR